MKLSLSKAIEEICDTMGWTYVPDYSGRCMYGRKCVGVEPDDGGAASTAVDITLALVEMLRDDPDRYDFDFDDLSKLGSARSDSMGMGIIVYFTGIQDDEVEDNEE